MLLWTCPSFTKENSSTMTNQYTPTFSFQLSPSADFSSFLFKLGCHKKKKTTIYIPKKSSTISWNNEQAASSWVLEHSWIRAIHTTYAWVLGSWFSRKALRNRRWSWIQLWGLVQGEIQSRWVWDYWCSLMLFAVLICSILRYQCLKLRITNCID